MNNGIISPKSSSNEAHRNRAMLLSLRLCLVQTILLLCIVQIDGGYWVCDWVNGRGWMYCSRGYCNTFGRKRSIPMADQQTSPTQNEDGTFCLTRKFCYACQPVADGLCHLTQSEHQSPLVNAIQRRRRRTDEDICV